MGILKREMTMEKFKVSVVIPVYNQEELVVRCIESIPRRKDVEIIVVNDGSCDGTLDNLIEYKNNKRKEVNIITYEHNMGVSHARNVGINASKGEYVVFVDSDDYVDEKIFNKIVNNYLKYDMVYYDMMINSGFVYKCDENNYKVRWGMFKFIKKDFIGRSRFQEGLNYAEDRLFTEELLRKMPTIYLTKLIMYHYNFPRTGSLSAIKEHRY